MNGISIIICCYNSAKRLPETLMHLAKQEVNALLAWEVILVNNNSTDATQTVAQNLWESYEATTILKVVDEPNPGLSYAREAGMQAANYGLFLWCDDDNWLCRNYVQTAFDIMKNHKDIGALGGWCDAAFEGEKPEWFDAQSRYFAVSKQGKQSGDITSKKGCLYGAGMVLRKTHWRRLKELGFQHLLSDRVGNTLSSGGDTEYCYALRLLGYKIWYDDRLYFKHYMTQGRMELEYVSRMRRAMASSNFILWPYLDLLKGRLKTPNDFAIQAVKGLPLLHIKKCAAMIFGSYEQKEVAKRYFRHLYFMLFRYKIYKANTIFLKSWKP